MKVLTGIVITLAFLVIIILIAFLIRPSQENGKLVEDTNPPSTSSGDLVQYKGEFLSVELPDRWLINEVDGDTGMSAEYRTSSKYTGLTSFEIKNSNKTLVSFEGTDGVGGINICEEIYKFNDTPDPFIQNMKDFAISQNVNEPLVTDLTSKDYSEFKLFDTTVRRIGENFYFMSFENGEVIPNCGINKEIINFKNGPHFGVEASEIFKGTSYQVKFNTNLTTEDAKSLELVLKSLNYYK